MTGGDEHNSGIGTAPSAPSLSVFFAALRPHFANTETEVSDKLPSLLDALRKLHFSQAAASVPPTTYFADRDLPELTRWLRDMESPLVASQKNGLFGNPWAAAALRRDEVRNASVLAWFLNPRGGHGCGNALLVFLLDQIRNHLPGFPCGSSSSGTVTVEECPDGSNANRVDIQIDDREFFIVVEVKIDAPEQLGQLERYGDVASARACGRPWAVVFLTPHGGMGKTAGRHEERVVPITWSAIAVALRRIAVKHTQTSIDHPALVPRFLAASFASHINF
jgi:hypothetical protein